MCFRTYCAGDRHQPQLRRQFFLKLAPESAGSTGRTFWAKTCDLDLQGTKNNPKPMTSAEIRSETAT